MGGGWGYAPRMPARLSRNASSYRRNTTVYGVDLVPLQRLYFAAMFIVSQQ